MPSTNKFGCCIECGEPDMYCECDHFAQRIWDQMWEHNVDMRPVIEWRTDDEIEYDEAMAAKNEVSEEELQQRMRDEIEMLVDLGFE